MPLKIDLDIAAECKAFNIPPVIIQAVRQAEGGSLLKAVRLSVPSCTTEKEAVHITCRSYVHAVSDFVLQDDNPDGDSSSAGARFVYFWAERWAPTGAANDPTRLNKYWPSNVLKLWRQR